MSTHPAHPTIEEVPKQIRLLPLEDQATLLENLRADLLQQTTALLERIEKPQPLAVKEDSKALYDVREFRGIGHGTWIDAGGVDEFIKQERASWDG